MPKRLIGHHKKKYLHYGTVKGKHTGKDIANLFNESNQVLGNKLIASCRELKNTQVDSTHIGPLSKGKGKENYKNIKRSKFQVT